MKKCAVVASILLMISIGFVPIVLMSCSNEIPVYTVRFDSRGGNAIEPIEALKNSKLAEPSTPSKTGYEFGGWYKDSSYSERWVFSRDMVRSDMTLYAKWNAEEYNVTLNKQGGNSGSDSITATYDSAMPSATVPARDEYLFDGYYDQTGGAGNQYYSATMESLRNWDKTENATLFANWVAIYDLVFDSQEGSAVSDIFGILYGVLVDEPIAPTRSGYVFAGWYKESSCVNGWDFAIDRIESNTTLYAKWIVSYTVTFAKQGGSGGTDSVQAVLNSPMPEATAPVKAGFAFDGYYDQMNGEGNQYYNATMESVRNCDKEESITLYAKWIISYYTVSFQSLGGSDVAPIENLLHGTMISEPVSPTRPLHVFGGWYRDSSCTQRYYFTTDVVTSNVTLYAKWFPPYTVIFDSRGGSPVAQITEATHGDVIPAPADPIKSGYAFGGWYRDSSCTQRYYFTTDVVTYSMTLYAKWFPPHSVSFDSQGGSNVGDITDITHGDLIPEPLAPSKSGYAFDGWHKQSSYVEQWDFDADEITSDMTLYAKWIVLHLVSFDSRGGSGVAAIEIGNGRKLVEPTAPTRPGYIFVGWYKEIACINRWNFSLDNVESTRTLYAKWIVLHLVSFDSRGGSGVAAIEVGNGRKLAEPATPIKTGYTFGGWYKEIACINQWNFSLDNVESTRTLYAKWTARNYTVTFDSQGGSSPNPASKSVTYDQTYGTLPTLTRNGYTFDGWWTEPDVTETQVTPDAIVSITSDLTLYAKWIGILKVRDIGPGGGHVFYDKGWETDGWRYLEAAPAGWSGGSEGPSRVWGGYGTAVGGTGTGIGTGASNTQKIVAKFGNAEPYGKKADYAAKVCADYRGGGYADWFLPSREELSLMYQNLKKHKLGGFTENTNYWSSSEYSTYHAWFQYFNYGGQYHDLRYNANRVRPVRAF